MDPHTKAGPVKRCGLQRGPAEHNRPNPESSRSARSQRWTVTELTSHRLQACLCQSSRKEPACLQILLIPRLPPWLRTAGEGNLRRRRDGRRERRREKERKKAGGMGRKRGRKRERKEERKREKGKQERTKEKKQRSPKENV